MDAHAGFSSISTAGIYLAAPQHHHRSSYAASYHQEVRHWLVMEGGGRHANIRKSDTLLHQVHTPRESQARQDDVTFMCVLVFVCTPPPPPVHYQFYFDRMNHEHTFVLKLSTDASVHPSFRDIHRRMFAAGTNLETRSSFLHISVSTDPKIPKEPDRNIA